MRYMKLWQPAILNQIPYVSWEWEECANTAQARGATRTDQNAISEFSRTPLLCSEAQDLEPAMGQQIVKVSAHIS